MTCIKTGCWVYLENYGYRVVADLYNVGDCTVVRWTCGSQTWGDPDERDYIVKYWSGDAVWHREDLGITVVPQEYFWAP